MRFHQTVMGVLAIVNRVDGASFSETDLNLLQALADQASAAEGTILAPTLSYCSSVKRLPSPALC